MICPTFRNIGARRIQRQDSSCERRPDTRVVCAGAAESWAGNQILQALLVAAVDRAQVPIFFLQAMNDYNTAPSLLLSAEMARVGKPYQVKIYPPYGTTVDDGHGGFCTNAPDVWGLEVLTFLRTYIP